MAKEAWETVVAYKLVWLRVLFLFLGPSITNYLAVTQVVDMDAKWPTMGIFARCGFWLGILTPGIGVLLAFIDQSLPHARAALEKKRNGDTNYTTPQDLMKEP